MKGSNVAGGRVVVVVCAHVVYGGARRATYVQLPFNRIGQINLN